MSVTIDSGTLPDLIHILIRDEETFQNMQKEFPEILADLVSLKSTPNCSCRAKVANFFTDKINKNPKMLEKYYKDQNAIINEIEEIKKKRLENIISGKVFKVPVGDDEWKKFYNTVQSKQFRSFSIVREYDYLWVYFL